MFKSHPWVIEIRCRKGIILKRNDQSCNWNVGKYEEKNHTRGTAKQFVINGGTFYLKSTSNWTTGLFYYCTPIINGGVFKADCDRIIFGNSWNARDLQIKGGYFQKPLGTSYEGDNHVPTFQYPSGWIS